MNDKYALVTGASSGIGYQYARVLAECGYNLLMVSNEAEAIEEKASIIRKDYPEISVVALMRDLGLQEAAKELYETVKSMGLEVEFLVNNAGVYHDREFIEDSEAFNMLIMNLHMITPAMLLYYFAKDMVSRHKGYIINMSSVTSSLDFQRLASYSSTKAFLKNLSRSTHIELRNQGVNVTCLRPGAVDTTLYNIPSSVTRIGLHIGLILTPEKLARIAVKAVMKGKCSLVPGLLTKILLLLISHIPTSVLRLVHKYRIF